MNIVTKSQQLKLKGQFTGLTRKKIMRKQEEEKENQSMMLTVVWNEYNNTRKRKGEIDRRIAVLGYPNTLEEAYSLMDKYLKKIQFKSYIGRQWVRDNTLIYDFGSHEKYFKLHNLNEETKRKLSKSS